MILYSARRFLIAGLLASAFILAIPPAANAGVIFQRPMYIGLSSGLVGYWSFNGEDMAGVTAYDSSGQGNNGTLTNGPARARGRLGQALKFDGVNDSVNVSDNSSLDLTEAVTISAWIKGSDWINVAEANYILAKRDFDGVEISNYQLGVSTGGFALFQFYNGAGPYLGLIDTATALSLGQWYHIAATYDRSAVRIFINGVEATSTTQTAAMIANSNTLSIGRVVRDTNTEFGEIDGLIDDVRIYNRALSPDEIKRLYKMGATTKYGVTNNAGLENGLVGYWSFNEPDMAGLTAYDRSGQVVNIVATSTAIMPDRVLGKIGQGLNFNGTTDRLWSTANPLDSLSQISISAWIKPRTTGGGGAGNGNIIGKCHPSANAGWCLAINNMDNVRSIEWFVGYDSSNLSAVTADNTVTLNKWNHVAMTWGGSQSRSGVYIYINGALSAIDMTSGVDGSGVYGPDSGVDLSIGDILDYIGDNFFDGVIDELRVYNRALSADEIKRLYNMGATTKYGVTNESGTLKDGLVGYWSFNGEDVASNGSVLTAYDRSGQGNNGTTSVASGARPARGRLGQALAFDGVNDYVAIPDTAVLRPENGSWTVSAWAKPPNANQISGIVAKRQTVSPFEQWSLLICGSENCGVSGKRLVGIFFQNDTSIRRSSMSTTDVSDGQLHHLVMVADKAGDTVRLYMDGSELAVSTLSNGAWPTLNNPDQMTIGNGNDSLHLNGLIDEVRVYNRALSADEIKRLYLMGR